MSNGLGPLGSGTAMGAVRAVGTAVGAVRAVGTAVGVVMADGGRHEINLCLID